MGGAGGRATGGWLSTPPAAAEGAPAGEDVSELKKQARYGGDTGEIWRRYWGDIGKMLGRCRGDIWGDIYMRDIDRIRQLPREEVTLTI